MFPEQFLKYPAVFLMGFLISFLLVPTVRALATRLGLVDYPGERRLNDRPVPRAGGVAVFAGFHCAAAFTLLFPWSAGFGGAITLEWWLGFIPISLLVLVIGLADDAIGLKWWGKLSGQLIAATLLWLGGARIYSFHGIDVPLFLDFALSVTWLIAVTNAFNLIDGLDGLATGLALIAALGLAGSCVLRGLPSDTLMYLGLAGACVAFLRYNFHPASIFLGDSGSMFIGFTIATLALMSGSKNTALAAIGVPLLAAGVPLFDTTLAVWRRSVRAIARRNTRNSRDIPTKNVEAINGIMHADMEHLHHRLIKSGLSQRGVAFWLYGLNGALVTLGLLSMIFNSQAVGLYLIAFVLGTYVVVKHLARVELWDSGQAILQGIRKPNSTILANILFPVLDAALLIGTFLMARMVVYFPMDYLALKKHLISMSPLWCGVPFIAIFLTGTYARVWSRARLTDFLTLSVALGAGICLSLGGSLLLHTQALRPVFAEALLYFTLSLVTILGTRAIPRLLQDIMSIVKYPSQREPDSSNILVYGAGYRGMLYLTQKAYLGVTAPLDVIIGFVDDDRNLRKKKVYGATVLGAWEELPELVERHKVKRIVLTTDLPNEKLSRLAEFCQKRAIHLLEWKPVERSVSGASAAENHITSKVAGGI